MRLEIWLMGKMHFESLAVLLNIKAQRISSFLIRKK